MTVLATHQNLLDAISTEFARDLSAVAPRFVEEAETEFNRVLRLPLQYTAEATLTTNASRYTDLPADFLEMDRVIWPDANGYRLPLQFVGSQDYRLDDTGIDTSNRPAEYALKGKQIEVIPAPTIVLTLKISYWAKIAALSGTVNDLYAKYPDVYLYRSLVAAAIYMRDTEALALYQGQYDRLMAEVKRVEGAMQKRTPQSLRTDVPRTRRAGYNVITDGYR